MLNLPYYRQAFGIEKTSCDEYFRNSASNKSLPRRVCYIFLFWIMKKLDFQPAKSTKDFRKNYKLHDMAEAVGKNLLTQWGISHKSFGEDNRYKKVWEKGEDKPDVIITYKGKSVFLDWKGKHKPLWILNKRAVTAYEKWSEIYSVPVIVAFFVFDKSGKLIGKKFAFLQKHSYVDSEKRQWDKNETVQFKNELPDFTKAELISYLT
jgi:hypothetical protein